MTSDSQPAARRLGDRGAGGGLVERGEDAAAGVHALGDLEAEVARDDRREAAGHAVGLRAGAAAELEHVAEARGGDQAGAGEAALEHGVGGGGGAVHDQVDVGERRRRPASRAARTPKAWLAGVVGVLARRTVPAAGSKRTRSVKVPPTSMPATMPRAGRTLNAPVIWRRGHLRPRHRRGTAARRAQAGGGNGLGDACRRP